MKRDDIKRDYYQYVYNAIYVTTQKLPNKEKLYNQFIPNVQTISDIVRSNEKSERRDRG